MSKWTVGSYSKFVKKLRQQDRRLTKNQARRVYHSMKKKLGRNVFPEDLDKHYQYKAKAVVDVVGEKNVAESVLQDLIVDQKRSLQTTIHRHYKESGYSFDLEKTGILKVSINTTQTRKKFSVRIT